QRLISVHPKLASRHPGSPESDPVTPCRRVMRGYTSGVGGESYSGCVAGPGPSGRPALALIQAARRRTTSDALVPPNPKEFASTTLISRFRAKCGERSIGVSTDGLSRLIVGGATRSRIARMEKMVSPAPAAPSRCPTDDLVDDIEMR